jgi:hypothetical protein
MTDCVHKPTSNEFFDVNFELMRIEQTKQRLPIGYIFIGTPPSQFGAEIDLQRLLVQFCALVVITGTLFFIFKTYPESNEPNNKQDNR